MKNTKFYKPVFFLAVFILLTATGFSQGTQVPITVKVHSGNFYYGAYLHLPDEYADSTAKKYPLLMFFHGAGEAGTNLSLVLNNGVPYWISRGANMQFVNPADGKLYKFICVSIQHPSYSCNADNIYYALIDLKSRYRIDTTRIYLTGLSAGGASTLLYPTRSQSDANKIAAIVPMSPATQSLTFSNLRYLANSRIESWFLTGSSDISYMEQTNKVIDTINSHRTGLTRKTAFSGGHCCWNNYYNPAYRENGMNIYEWLLTHKLAPNQTPIANAGNDISTLPVPVGLNGSNSSDPDGAIVSYVWTKLSGPAQYTINNPNASAPVLSNTTAGTYQFQLSVTDNRGAVSSDQVTINVTQPSLPVTLRNFRAAGSGTNCYLYWQTETESNSDYFEVERSTDGFSFSSIGSKAAAGNSNQTIYYSFIDNSMPGGITCYRLKQADKDGSYTYSSVVRVQKRDKQSGLSVLPNPATDITYLTLFSAAKGKTSIQVFSAMGKKILTKEFIKTNEVITEPLALSSLSPGVYIVTVQSGTDQQQQIRFVKK